jgi:hypothetical protein
MATAKRYDIPYRLDTKYRHLHPGRHNELVCPIRFDNNKLGYIYYNLCDKDEGRERVFYLLSQHEYVNQTFIIIGLDPIMDYYELAVALIRKYKLDDTEFLSTE